MDEGRALSALTVPGSAAGPDAPSKAKRSKDDAGGEFPTRGQIVGMGHQHQCRAMAVAQLKQQLSLINISEPTRPY